MTTSTERSPRRTRRPAFPLRVGGWILLIVVPLAVWFLKGLEERPFTSVDLGAIQSRGREIVKKIEAFHGWRQMYPANLEALPGEIESTEAGDWRYRPSDDLLSFELSVGDLHRDGFVQKYDSDSMKWHLDR